MAKLIKKIDKNIGAFDFVKKEGFTLKSLGLLVFILGLPDKSVFSLEDLSIQFTDGITSIRNAVSELEKLGYFKRKKVRESGKINHIYIVSNFKQKKENIELREIILKNEEDVIEETIEDEIIEDKEELSDKLDNLKDNDLNNYLLEIDKDIKKKKIETASELTVNALEVFNYYTRNVTTGSETISLQYIKKLLEDGFVKEKMIEVIKDYKNKERSFLYKKADVFFQEVFLGLLTEKKTDKPVKQLLFNKLFKGGSKNGK